MLPPRPLLGVWGCLSYPTLFSAGWGWCLGRWLSFAPCSRWCPLSGCTSLRLRVLGDSWFSSLCSPDRRSASRFTYPALTPVSRLSFRLGEFSFGWGFGLFLSVLLAPWGCRCACCYPPCGCESREFFPLCLVLPLLGSVTFSRVCSSVGIAHSFLPSLLLGGGLVRFCGGLCWHSLAMSWACPPPFLCVGLVVRSRRIVAPLAPCLSWRFPSLVRVSLLRSGVSPCVWSHRGPWGVAVAPPISPYTGPGWSPPFCRVPLELRSVFYVLLCDIPPVFMAIIWSVSPTLACPLRVTPIRGLFLGHLRGVWLVGHPVLLLAIPGLCHLRWLMVTTAGSWCLLR